MYFALRELLDVTIQSYLMFTESFGCRIFTYVLAHISVQSRWNRKVECYVRKAMALC